MIIINVVVNFVNLYSRKSRYLILVRRRCNLFYLRITSKTRCIYLFVYIMIIIMYCSRSDSK